MFYEQFKLWKAKKLDLIFQKTFPLAAIQLKPQNIYLNF